MKTIKLEIDLDVTELLEITKYEIPDSHQQGNTKGSFPNFISKTDETRIQGIQQILEELQGKPYYISQKIDGSSTTQFYHPEDGFGVCSRKVEVVEGGNAYWEMAYKYNIKNWLKEHAIETGQYLAMQGEVAGPGIQGNRLGLEHHDLFVFNLFDIKTGNYLDYSELISICQLFEWRTVPILEAGDNFNYTFEELLLKAKGKYDSGRNQEGIVIRPQIEQTSRRLQGNRMSFKVINNDFLLEGK
jgi:RNA ligase (TIGR02306 family)